MSRLSQLVEKLKKAPLLQKQDVAVEFAESVAWWEGEVSAQITGLESRIAELEGDAKSE